MSRGGNEYTKHCTGCIYYTGRSGGRKVCVLHKKLKNLCTDKIIEEVI